MQNFTLGKKGMSMLLFAFILLIGNLPSYGQSCPTTANTPSEQTRCFLETVGDITTDGDAVFQTNLPTDTQPIPDSEILESGSYFVGSSTLSCERIEVVVTVTSTQYPDNTLYPGSTSFSISPCLNTDFSTEDLAGFFTPLENYEIRVYGDEFSVNEASGQLTPGESYFVGQVPQDPESANCPSLRVAVGYNPANAPAPIATTPQNLCEGATVADLEAEGTSPFTQAIRWYRTQDSFQPLAETTELINGQTYYASQIINDRNDPFPPCESEDRVAVTVNVTEATVLDPASATVCDTDVEETFPSIDAISNFYIELSGLGEGGTFDPTPAEIAEMYQNDEDGLGNFTTTYTLGDGECPTSIELTVSIVPVQDANAGTINDITVECGSEEVIILDDSLLSEDATTGGTFSGEGVNEEGNFDPAIGPGTYEITYTVDDTADCVTPGTSDTTTFNITVQGLDLGEPIVMEMCITEVQELTTEEAIAIFNNELLERGITNIEEGTFSPSLEVVAAQIGAYLENPTPSQTFETTFSVSDCGEDSVLISLTINDTTPATTGEIADFEVCSNQGPVNLYDRLNDNNTPGGTFLDESGMTIEDGLLDVSQLGDIVVTYTVQESDEETCLIGEDSTEFTVTVTEGITLESPAPAIVCEDDVQETFPSLDAISNFYVELSGLEGGGTFDPTPAEIAEMYQNDEDGLGDFTTTYTVGDGECPTSIELTVSIVPTQDANAGTIADITVDCASEDVIVLDDSLLSEDANTGGTFTGEGLNEDGNFDPAVGPGTYEITYSVDDSADCVTEGTSDSTTFTITVSGSGTIIDSPAPAIVCEDDVQETFPSLDAISNFYLELSGLEGGGTFDPTPAEIAEMYQNDEDGLGDFTTTYTVGDGECPTSIELTVSIVPSQDANAGTIADITVDCASEDVIVLDDSLLSEDANTGGTFTGEGLNEDGNFDPAVGPGTYEITYSVDDSADCVTEGTSDSTTFTITVLGSGTIIDSPAPAIVCEDDVQETFSSIDEINDFYVALSGLEDGGTFDPTPAEIAEMYQNDEDGLGDFTTTYTVGEGECPTSVELTVRIVPTQDANAGTIADITVDCASEDIIELNDSLLSEDANTGGTFTGEGVNEEGNFDPAIGPGTYEITYSVDASADCVNEGTSDSTTFNITVSDEANAGGGATLSYCITEIEEMNEAEALAIFNNLLPANTDEGGEFSPTTETLIAQFLSNPIGTFTTTYTVSNGDCEDSAEYTVIINDTEVANAGPATTLTFCSSEGELNLTDFLSSEANPNGTFEELEGNMFNPSEAGVDTYTFTYTVDSSTACVTGEDSAVYTVEVIAGANAGTDNEIEVCLSEVDNLSEGQVRNLFLSLLDPGVSEEGTFSPTIAEIIAQYNDGTKEGDYTTTYTVSEGDCTASVDLTVTVLATPDAPVADAEQFFCSANNPTVGDLTVTGENAVWFEDADLTTQADVTDPLVDGEVYYAVAISDNECFSSATSVTVTIDDSEDAPVADAEQTFCLENNPTVADLDITGNNVVVYEDADLTVQANDSDPLVDGEDYYATTACAEDATMITVTVTETPATPVAEAQQSFCIVDSPTVGDIDITGENIVWYSDADLTTVIPETTELTNDVTYYAISSVGDGACESSQAVAVTVTLNTAVSPTIQPEGNEFCRNDNPTVQDLIGNLNGDGIRVYTTAEGGTPLDASTALENGVTYYATATDATTGCESDERRAVNVEVAFCGIPEGFSPNGDNINDRFVIPDIAEDYPNYTIQIFNRWGNVVFEGNANTPDWDGVSNQSTTLGDNVLPAGVYFYILNYNDGQTTPVQGKLYLSR